MMRRAFGWTGVEVPVIGQGTWQIRDKARAEETLRAGLDLGMTHVDTAELYTGSESVVARAIKDRRDEIFLVSKVLPKNASYAGTLDACAKSLARLGTAHLDMYLLHWRGDAYPLEDTMRALGELVDNGTIKFLGVSNFDAEDLEDAERVLGDHRIASNQVLYHLGARGIESDLIPACREKGIAIVGYSPYGSGRFPPPESKGGRVLADIARRLDKTPRQVALAFLTRDPLVFAIPKAESVPHVEENAGGAFTLDAEAVNAIDAAFPMEPGLTFL